MTYRMAARDTRVYELFSLVMDSKESEIPAVRTEMEKIVTEFGGTFLPEETTEKRNLAYEIGKERRGTYIARRFSMPEADDAPFSPDAPEKVNAIEEMTRALRLYPSIARFLIVRADRLPELKPIPREERPKTVRRDDRRGGGRRFAERPSTPTPRPSIESVRDGGAAAKEREEKEREEAAAAKPVVAKEKKEQKPVAHEDLDKQLKEVLDI